MLVFGWQKRCVFLCKLGGRENCHHAVVITRRNRVKLVVMAFSALKRMTEKGLPDRVGYIIEPLLTRDPKHTHACLFPRSHSQKTGSNPVLARFWVQLISGNLLSDKLRVWLVLIERADYIITITPCVGTGVVVGKARSVCIPGNVKPLLPKLFSILWVTHQLCNQAFDCRLWVCRISIGKFGCCGPVGLGFRRQTGQAKCQTSHQFMSRCRRCGGDVQFLQSSLDKPGNGIAVTGWFNKFQGLVRPQARSIVPSVAPVIGETA